MKIKNFGWRALHNGLAVFANLKYRGCECDNLCLLCGEDEESTFHRLVTCPDSQWIWKTSPLRIEVPTTMRNDFKNWCETSAMLDMDERWWALFWNIKQVGF